MDNVNNEDGGLGLFFVRLFACFIVLCFAVVLERGTYTFRFRQINIRMMIE